MTALAAGEGVWVIALPTPYPVGPSNAVLLEGDPLALVDCGVDSPESRAALSEGLARAGYRIGDIERLVYTHPHPDHVGSGAWVAEQSGCEVVAYPGTAVWLNEAAQVHRARFAAGLLRECGVPDPLLDDVGRFVARNRPLFRPAQPHRLVGEGDRLRLGGRDWTVLHTPGHSDGHISLWHEPSGMMIVADHLLPDVSSNALVDPVSPDSFEPVRSLPRYVESLRRVAELPVRLVLPGHGRPFAEARALIGSRLEKVEARARALLETLSRRACHPAALAGELFPRLPRESVFLAVSEVLGHLFLLEDRGAVDCERSGGVRVYRARGRAAPAPLPVESVLKGGEPMADFAEIFAQVGQRLAANPAKLAGLNAGYQFDLTGDGGGTYHLEVRNGKAEAGPGALAAPNCTITMAATDFLDMMAGKLNATSAFMSGKLKLKGDIGLAMKLQSLLG